MTWKRFLKLSCIAIVLFCLPASAFATWTITSVVSGTARPLGVYKIVPITASLSSDDAAAGTNLDLWTVLQAAMDSVDKQILGPGGILHSVEYYQGASAPDNDFLLTIYSGNLLKIWSATIDYNQTGQGRTGGIYAGNTLTGVYPTIQNGLTIDIADTGSGAVTIVLIFNVLV